MNKNHPNLQSGLRLLGDDNREETGNGLSWIKDNIISLAEPQPGASADISCRFPSGPCRPARTWACWRLASLLFGVTVFLFRPELLSLLESIKLSVTVDLCFNFCSQPAGSLLLWGRFMVVLVPFFWMNAYLSPALASGSPLATRTSAPEIWKTSFLWQPEKSLSVTEACKGNQPPLSHRYWAGKEPTQPPRDLEPGCLLSHLQIFFFF